MESKTTIHLDKSECKNRMTISWKSQIAKYWREKILELGLFMDWGEAECWACGRFEADNDVTDKELTLNYFKDIFIDGSHFKNDES